MVLAPPDGHPSPDALAAFFRGHAPPAAAPAIAAHLDDCPDCLARLGSLRDDDDPFLSGLRAAEAPTISFRGRPAGVVAPPAVPGYHLKAELGRGGMGVVYAADSLGLNRQVAVKLLRDAGRATPDELARFRAEALALGRLQHPNVVQVFDAGTAGGAPFVVLEYVPGGTLADLGPLAPREAARLMATVARGVQAAHDAGVIHRDLKPSNVLLAADGTPKVSDFGLAKLNDAAATATLSGTLAGTPAYMAPEQAAGGLAAPAQDIYALGAVLYHLLAGRPPFAADTVLEVLRKVREEPPASLPRSVPRDLATVAGKCLRKEPGKRYASAAELADDLDRFLTGEPIRARPAGYGERLAKWGRRHPAAAALAVALLAAVLLGLGGVTVQYRRAEGERQKARNVAAEQALDRGILLAEAGRVADGLGLFAEAARLSAGTDPRLDSDIALSSRLWEPRRRANRRLPLTGTPYTAVAFSPDGGTLLTADWGNYWGKPDQPGQAKLWADGDYTTPRLTVTHTSTIRGAAWHPGGAAFVTAGSDGIIRGWDAATGATVGEPLAFDPPEQIMALAFSPAGDRLAAACSPRHPDAGRSLRAELRVWDWATRRLIGRPVPLGFAARGLGWSPDGKLVAVAGIADFDRPAAQTGVLAVFDPAAGTEAWRRSLPDPQRAASWHPAGWLAAGGTDGVVRFWEADGRRRPGVLPHPMPVNKVRFTPDGAVLVAACGDAHADNPSDGPGEVQCWELATGEKVGPPIAEKRYSVCNRVNDVAVGPDGRAVAVAGESGLAWVGELPLPAAPLGTATVPRLPSLSWFSPDGSAVAVLVPAAPGADSPAADLHLLDGRTLARRAVIPLPGVRRVKFHPAGHTLMIASWDHLPAELRLVDVATGAVRPGPDGAYGHPAWSADGAELWGVDAAGLLHRWEAATLRPVGDPHPVGVAADLGEHPQPAVLAKADGRAAVWYPGTGRRVGLDLPAQRSDRLRGHLYDSGAVLVTVAGLGQSGRWELSSWDAATGRRLGGPIELVKDGDLRPVADGRAALIGFRDSRSEYHLFDPRTLAPLSPAVVHNERGQFHPSGRFLATVSGVVDEHTRLVSFTGRTLGPPVPHPARTYVVKFSPDGTRLLTGGADRTIRLWAVP